tara:strand:- start:132 stop:341 length:210 start_codon:yes stop_codon:yes gene_type:complete
MTKDWRYNEQKLALREQVLLVLFTRYAGSQVDGLPEHSQKSIYECAHDWVSQGNVNTNGIVKYYEAYYA